MRHSFYPMPGSEAQHGVARGLVNRTRLNGPLFSKQLRQAKVKDGLNIVFLGVMTEGAIANFEQFRRPCSYAARFFERLLEVAALGFRDLLLEIKAFRWKLAVLSRGDTDGRASCIARDAVGQDAQRNFPARFESHGAFQSVFQFSNVSRPIVGFQPRHRFRRDSLNGFFHGLTEALEEVAREEWNILAAFAQGRHLYGNHAEAIIKILAEAAFRNLFFELLVRSGASPCMKYPRA